MNFREATDQCDHCGQWVIFDEGEEIFMSAGPNGNQCPAGRGFSHEVD